MHTDAKFVKIITSYFRKISQCCCLLFSHLASHLIKNLFSLHAIFFCNRVCHAFLSHRVENFCIISTANRFGIWQMRSRLITNEVQKKKGHAVCCWRSTTLIVVSHCVVFLSHVTPFFFFLLFCWSKHPSIHPSSLPFPCPQGSLFETSKETSDVGFTCEFYL